MVEWFSNVSFCCGREFETAFANLLGYPLSISDTVIPMKSVLFVYILLLVAAQSEPEVCAKFGYDTSVLDINLEWVIQGYNIGFQGFFVELLGFAGSLVKLLPQSRLVKSSFKHSFDEPFFGDQKTFLNSELFKVEMDNIEVLASSTQHREITKHPNANRFGSKESFCGKVDSYEQNYAFAGAELAKGVLSGATDPAACCEKCYLNPLCLAWTFDAGLCYLKAHMSMTELIKAGAVSGRMISEEMHTQEVAADGETGTTTRMQLKQRHPAPRVVIYHGTTCIHQNQSAPAANRDINTIRIGRVMLERPYLTGGFNLDEYAVLQCAARMEELWVPTEWHKDVFQRLLTQQGSASSTPPITVIPEAVDTTLFDPAFVRTGSNRSIVGPGRLLLVDGSRVTSGVAPADTLVVHKSCTFVEDRVQCDHKHRFEFLSVFKWEYRKGWDVLLDAYWAAFRREDDVVLRIRSYVPFTSVGDRNITRLIALHAQNTLGVSLSELAKVVWENGVDGFTVASEVVVSTGTASSPSRDAASDTSEEISPSPAKETHLTREDMRDLLASANAFVLATRGEGWGLPVAESMAMALPVIVTNHSGPAAFATVDNAYLIPTLPELDHLAFAKPDAEALVNIMRQVVFESGEAGDYRAQQRGRAARETMKKISPDSIVCKMNDRIRYHALRRGWNFP